MRERGAVRTAVTAFAPRRAVAEAVYVVVSAVPAVAGFVLVVVALVLGSAFTLTLVGAVLGVLFLVAGLALARGLGALQRALAGGLLGERVAAPAAPLVRGGAVARTEGRLRDAAAWRSVAYALLRLPVALCGLYAASWWAVGAVNLVAPVRRAVASDDLNLVTPLPFGGSPHLGSFAATLGASAAGCGILLVA
ncbi:sensor histidine kinase, partial [Streptomyces sp. SID5785]|uniref:sensor domain-containing protein n=1 Tax=Streptomyces sp. SID5785 TaxID=2690309 RepID=UPI0013618EF2